MQAISQLQPQQPPAKLWRKLQGWLAQQSEDRIRVRAIFGQSEQSELAGLARYYYGLSQLPLQELTLKRGRHGWSVRQQQSLSPLELSPSEKELMLHHAQALVGTGDEEQAAPLYQLAILVDPDDGRASSDAVALERFIKAAAAQGIRAEILAPSAIERLPEFDTLWLRSETAVGHYTFEFARRAEQLKMPVIDSSRAILACSNKLYLYELMVRSGVPMPPTMVVTRRGRHHVDELVQRLGLPLMVKVPDGAQGRDLAMASDEQQLARLLDEGLGEIRPALGAEPDPRRVRLAHRLSRWLAAVCLPPFPARARQPHPPPQAPSRHEPHRGAAAQRGTGTGAANRPPRRPSARQRPVRGRPAPAGARLRAAGNHRQSLDTWRY